MMPFLRRWNPHSRPWNVKSPKEVSQKSVSGSTRPQLPSSPSSSLIRMLNFNSLYKNPPSSCLLNTYVFPSNTKGLTSVGQSNLFLPCATHSPDAGGEVAGGFGDPDDLDAEDLPRRARWSARMGEQKSKPARSTLWNRIGILLLLWEVRSQLKNESVKPTN